MGLERRPHRYLRHLAWEIAGRETLASQQLPLSPLSPISILVVNRDSTLPPLSPPRVGARKKYA
jgi:hypothetical protein